MTKKYFKAEQFTATEHSTAEDKAKFANLYVIFVESGFDRKYFTERFYRRLSLTFGHIAHYSQEGFFDVWFFTTVKQRLFVEHAINYCPHGDPAFTYSDVEAVLIQWLKDNNVLAKFDDLAVQDRYYNAISDIADGILSCTPAVTQEKVIQAVVDATNVIRKTGCNIAVSGERLLKINEALTRKFNVQCILFRLASVSNNTNSFGLHGHVFMAEDGEVWEVCKYRNRDAIPIGHEIGVAVVKGEPQWGRLGYEVPRRLKKATAKQVDAVWGSMADAYKKIKEQ
jgi:hypothetical protein